MWLRGERYARTTKPPEKGPGTHCIGGLCVSQGRFGRVRKTSPASGFDPRTLQAVTSRYTG